MSSDCNVCLQLLRFAFALHIDLLVHLLMTRLSKMRALKVARQRRDRSPDQYWYVMQAFLSTFSCPSYRYQYAFSQRGYPSLHIAVLLDEAADADAAVDNLLRHFDDFDDVSVFATQSQRDFYALCFFAAAVVNHDDDVDNEDVDAGTDDYDDDIADVVVDDDVVNDDGCGDVYDDDNDVVIDDHAYVTDVNSDVDGSALHLQ